MTWQQNLDRADRSFVAFIQIEAVGEWLSDNELLGTDGTGLALFLTARADYMGVVSVSGGAVVDSGAVGAHEVQRRSTPPARFWTFLGESFAGGVVAGCTFRILTPSLGQQEFLITSLPFTHTIECAGQSWSPVWDGANPLTWEIIEATVEVDPPIYKDYLQELPDLLTERVDPDGGFPDLGELTFKIVDHSDYLTSKIRTESPAVTRLTASITLSATTLVVDSAASIDDETVIFIDSEAMRVTNVAGTTLTVDRGYLGTDAIPHQQGRPVYTTLPTLRNRRASLYCVPKDGTIDDVVLVGEYVIDKVSWDEGLNVWEFAAKSQLKYLARMAPIQTRHYRVKYLWPAPTPPTFERYGNRVLSTPVENVWGVGGFLKNGKEILSVTGDVRDILGTGEEDFKVGQIVPLVLVARKDIGSFRYSPGPSPSTDRTTGTWNITAHWVDICLIIMTSSAWASGSGVTDGLELTNYIAAYGNYSSLPPGYGLGLPAARIDWAAWQAVKARTLDYEFPNFVYGDEPMSFAELLDKHFLKPIGAYVSTQDGVSRLVLPRIPMQGEATVVLGASNILAKKVGRGQYLPRMDCRLNVAQKSESILYEVGPTEAPRTFNNAEQSLSTYYGDADPPIRIPVPGADPNAAEFLDRCAERKLFRANRPNMEIDVDVDFGLYETQPGDLLSLTLSEVPNLQGTRGVSGAIVEVLNREPTFDPKDGAYIHFGLLGYGQGARVGRVCPMAYVSSLAVLVATVTQNRYTQANAPSPLPVTDASAFTVGDVVRCYNLDGTVASATTATITLIAGNAITLSGNCGGTLAVGRMIGYAAVGNQTATQYGRYVSLADQATLTVGAGAIPAWQWGEP